MDQNKSDLFGSTAYGSSDPSMNIPLSSNRGLASLSPYLNIDPAYISPNGPEFIFPEGASRQRGRFELAFSQIGGSVIAAGFVGGTSGFLNGMKEAQLAGQLGTVRRAQILNHVTKNGAAFANSAGVIAVIYSGFGTLLSWLRGQDDELNTLAAGTATGLLYKSSSGLRKCGIGGVAGFSLAALYCLVTNRQRLLGGDKSSSY